MPSPNSVAAAKATSSAAPVPKPGRPNIRLGLGRNQKLGRRPELDSPAPILGYTNAQGPQGHAASSPAAANNKSEPAKTRTTKPATSNSKSEKGYRKGVKASLPPKLITRPDRTKKDIVISPAGIERNMARLVGKMGTDKRYHWVKTDEFDFGVYDLVADLKSLSKDDRKKFWATNYVQVDLDVTYLSGVSEILEHMERLGKVFTENLGQIYINLIFPNPEEVDVVRRSKFASSALVVPTIAAILPLVQKVSEMENLYRCVVTLHTPPDNENHLYHDWLDHAVPFMALPASSWRLDWVSQDGKKQSPPKPVRGGYRHHLNIEWSKAEKDLAMVTLVDGVATLNIKEKQLLVV